MSDAAERLYERVLVVRCQTGDAAALAELIARYSLRLRFYLCKMAGDAAAEDLRGRPSCRCSRRSFNT
jgi:hypothetical protein